MKNFSTIPRMQHMFLAVLLFILMNSQSFAQSVWSGNGHTYEAVYAPGLTWAQAQAACEARGGYLVTITSSEEEDFVKSLFENNPSFWYVDGFNNALGPWTGGIQASGSSEPGGGWGWVNGEPFAYTDWSSHDPDNCCGGNQNRIEFIRDGNVPPTRWTDVEDFARFVRGYIFESSPSTTTCVPVPSGLVSWWPGEGNASDIQDGNDGTLQNGTAFAPGMVGQAFSFDGFDDVITVPASTNLDMTAAYTFEAWVNSIGSADLDRLIVARGDASAHDLDIKINRPLVGNTLQITHNRTNGATTEAVLFAAPPLNQLFHLAVTFDGAKVSAYYNGVEAALVSVTNTIAAPLYTNRGWLFGRTTHPDYGGLGRFVGILDEIGIYARALSASEIEAIYNAGSAGKCKECTPPEVSINGNGPVCPHSIHTYTATTNATNPSFNWSATGGTINGSNTGSSVSATAGGAGTMAVSMEVTDGATNCTNTARLEVSVEDHEPPVIITFPTPHILWPPNHQYETILVAQCVDTVADNCALLSPSDVTVDSVSSDEPEDVNGGGDGNALNDIVIASDCKSVQLRSERQGGGNGRVYTLYLSVRDGNGNTGSAMCFVTVPHSQNGNPAVDDGPAYFAFGNCSSAPKLAENFGQMSESETMPEGYALEQNYPNPFNPSTVISFQLPADSDVTLAIYNTSGQLVHTLISGEKAAGRHSVVWDAKDDRGLPVTSGVYLYRLRAGSIVLQKKLVLMK